MEADMAGRKLLGVYLLALVCVFQIPVCFAVKPERDTVVVGYVFPENTLLAAGEIKANKLTRVNYAFANIKEGRVVNGFPHDDENLATLVAMKRENPSLTVLVSVGGWLWSGAFSDLALTTQSRRLFLESAADYVRIHHLDGVDIDWEFPGLPGALNNFRAEDKENYTLLIQELRIRFNHLEKELHRRLFITVATGATSEFLEHTEMNKVSRYVDTVNLMAYDYYEPGDGPITGHHAPLYSSHNDPKGISVDRSVREYEMAGVPAGKIVLGVPFYGHVWSQVPAVNMGLFQAGEKVPPGPSPLKDGPEEMLRNGFRRYWDFEAKAPYLYNAERGVFVSYDDPESLALKCGYVLAHHLRGVMFWDYESDTSGTLLDAVDKGLKRNHVQGESK